MGYTQESAQGDTEDAGWPQQFQVQKSQLWMGHLAAILEYQPQQDGMEAWLDTNLCRTHLRLPIDHLLQSPPGCSWVCRFTGLNHSWITEWVSADGTTPRISTSLFLPSAEAEFGSTEHHKGSLEHSGEVSSLVWPGAQGISYFTHGQLWFNSCGEEEAKNTLSFHMQILILTQPSSSSSPHYCPFALDCISWWGKKDLADQQQQLPRKEEALNEQADFPEQSECFLQPALLVTLHSCPLPTGMGYEGLTWQYPK